MLPLYPTSLPEIAKFYDIAHSYEKDDDVLYVRFTHGFFLADIAEMGMSVLVAVKSEKKLAQQIADEMGNLIWKERSTLQRHYVTMDEALDVVLEPGEGPVILADASDNTGSGGVGDTTHLLKRILGRGIRGGTIATIVDPYSVQLCKRANVGATVTLNLGGKNDPLFSGGPVYTKAKVLKLTDGRYRNKDKMMRGLLCDMGDCAVVDIGGNKVIITTYRVQPYDLEAIRSQGIIPERQRFIVVKSAVHYRESYGTIARQMIDLALPGYAVPIPDRLPFKHWNKKGMYPAGASNG